MILITCMGQRSLLMVAIPLFDRLWLARNAKRVSTDSNRSSESISWHGEYVRTELRARRGSMPALFSQVQNQLQAGRYPGSGTRFRAGDSVYLFVRGSMRVCRISMST
jgi:hypothetical protein